ncbi:MAG: hypothetical protein IPK59_19600 [Rhodospirillaceae bacterium]|nr:hypothetical protein [Rhodospirillaceae bacterium]
MNKQQIAELDIRLSGARYALKLMKQHRGNAAGRDELLDAAQHHLRAAIKALSATKGAASR